MAVDQEIFWSYICTRRGAATYASMVVGGLAAVKPSLFELGVYKAHRATEKDFYSTMCASPKPRDCNGSYAKFHQWHLRFLKEGVIRTLFPTLLLKSTMDLLPLINSDDPVERLVSVFRLQEEPFEVDARDMLPREADKTLFKMPE